MVGKGLKRMSYGTISLPTMLKEGSDGSLDYGVPYEPYKQFGAKKS